MAINSSQGVRSTPSRRAITRELAAYATGATFAALPEHVRAETARTFLNWLGCVLGGCGEPSVDIAVATAREAGGNPQATVIGRRLRTDLATAAFVNCLSSSVLAFDDTHLATVTHPTGPVGAGLLALSERESVSGEDFATALALGIEIQCRLSNVLLMPPAQANLSLYVTGLTGPIGAAAALGRLLRFDEQEMVWAIGLAAAQASGFRATHGSMAGLVVPALGARSGVAAALLAAKGFTCSEAILESDKGFIDIFSQNANLDLAVDGLGQQFELLSNAYKPYPCGIVIHAAIDACLEIAERLGPDDTLNAVAITVHPLTLTLTDRRSPTTELEAMVSIYHWAAAALLRHRAGLPEMRQDCIDDPRIAALRSRITVVGEPLLRRDEAIAEVTLGNGSTLRSHVRHARGSIERPMTDDDLDVKFRAQASSVLSSAATDALLRLCRSIANIRDVGKELVSALNA